MGRSGGVAIFLLEGRFDIIAGPVRFKMQMPQCSVNSFRG